METTSNLSCDNIVPAPFGNITSLGWPNNYPLNTDQCWNITCDLNDNVENAFKVVVAPYISLLLAQVSIHPPMTFKK